MTHKGAKPFPAHSSVLTSVGVTADALLRTLGSAAPVVDRLGQVKELVVDVNIPDAAHVVSTIDRVGVGEIRQTTKNQWTVQIQRPGHKKFHSQDLIFQRIYR